MSYQILKIFSITIIRFMLVGGVGALCYFVASYLLTKLGFIPWISSFVVYILLVPIVFFWQRKFVFQHKVDSTPAFLKYIALQLVSICSSAAIPFMSNEKFSPELSFIFVIVFVTIFNFFLQKNWVFKS